MRNNFLFLGFAVPNEEMNKIFKIDQFPSVQTHKFNWNIIKGIESYDNFECTYISARPVTDYPYFPKIKIRKNNWVINIQDKEIKITEIPYINISIFKLLTRFLYAMYYSFKNYHKVKTKSGVIVYSVHVPFMLVGYILSKVYKVDYIAIWTDPPSVSNEKESFLKSKLRKIELTLSKYLMKKATKVIALTKYLAEDFAPGKPYLVIEGIIDDNDVDYDETVTPPKKSAFVKVVYTGSLEKRYGIKNIVEGFLLVNNANAILEIYGRGDYENELKKVCESNKNISYKGFIANDEILKIQRNADFLINARSDEEEYVKYSFPSKTLEYMLSGTPLITTMLPGIPEGYKDYVFVLKNNEPITISNMINSLRFIDEEEKRNFGIKAQKYAINRNYYVQGKKIIDFIEEI